MRQFYVHFFDLDVSSSYRLFYADTRAQREALPEGARQLSKRHVNELLKLARRLHRKQPGCQADLTVYPADYDRSKDITQDPNYILSYNVWIPANEPPAT